MYDLADPPVPLQVLVGARGRLASNWEVHRQNILTILKSRGLAAFVDDLGESPVPNPELLAVDPKLLAVDPKFLAVDPEPSIPSNNMNPPNPRGRHNPHVGIHGGPGNPPAGQGGQNPAAGQGGQNPNQGQAGVGGVDLLELT